MPKDIRSWISETWKALVNSPAYPPGCGDEGEGLCPKSMKRTAICGANGY